MIDWTDNLKEVTAYAFKITQKDIHANALEHGWYNEPRSFGDVVALCHSELSEALEEYRNGHDVTEIYYGPNGKPEGVPVELADCIIRILDFCGAAGIDIGTVLLEKHIYNKGRSYKHGGKRI